MEPELLRTGDEGIGGPSGSEDAAAGGGRGADAPELPPGADELAILWSSALRAIAL